MQQVLGPPRKPFQIYQNFEQNRITHSSDTFVRGEAELDCTFSRLGLYVVRSFAT